MIVLITGGTHSGKRAFAERYAHHLGDEGLYIATAEASDEQAKERIALHRRRREEEIDFYWRATYETPLELCEQLELIRVESRSDRSKRRTIILDCLTFWMSNLLLSNTRQSDVFFFEEIDRLVAQLQYMTQPVLMVSHEGETGFFPAHRLGRRYYELVGVMNQRLAEVSQQVFLMTCGIPVEIKSRAFRLGGL